jgi:diguanylate cyclase (GGDEF)-like protein
LACDINFRRRHADEPSMEESMASGREALDQLLDVRRVIGRSSRVLLGIVVAYAAARTLQEWLIEPNFSDRTSAWVEAPVFVLLALAMVMIVSGLALRRDLTGVRTVVADHERAFEERTSAQTFLRDVYESFEMSEREDELFLAAGIALNLAAPGNSELLVADASNAHLARFVVAADRPAPACGVVTPGSCPAVRHGKTMLFGDPNGLSACPKLRERDLPSTSVAACIPVNVLGSPTAVLHSVCHETLDRVSLAAGVRRLEGVAVRFGSRLGLLRATERSRLQGDLDPLTGLFNRRTLENRVRDLVTAEVPFSLAMLDLDHFKVLNDTFGHATGDRALRLFAGVMRSVMRENDIVGRHGGEEFVVVLPHSDVTQSAPVLHRLREQLQVELASAEVPPFTYSAGLVDSSATSDYFVMLHAADEALMSAKANGRDRIVIGDTASVPQTAREATPRAAPVTPST